MITAAAGEGTRAGMLMTNNDRVGNEEGMNSRRR